MTSRELDGDQPMRPNRNARRYSTFWNRGRNFRGSSTLSRKPFLTVQPLSTLTTPPVATVLESSRNGRTTRPRLVECRMQSASIEQNSG